MVPSLYAIHAKSLADPVVLSHGRSSLSCPEPGLYRDRRLLELCIVSPSVSVGFLTPASGPDVDDLRQSSDASIVVFLSVLSFIASH